MKRERGAARSTVVSVTIVGVMGLGWALPLTWSMVAMIAAALAGLGVVALWRPISEPAWRSAFGETTAVASCALLTTGLIGLGYAVFALTHVGAFGTVRRLGYPFLVATGLRLPGGACLLILCGIVSVIPLLFRAQDTQPAST